MDQCDGRSKQENHVRDIQRYEEIRIHHGHESLLMFWREMRLFDLCIADLVFRVELHAFAAFGVVECC